VPDRANDPGRAELATLLGEDRLAELVRAAAQPEARALREALRSIGGADLADAERIERELRVAQRVQRSLVLIAEPALEGWEIASDYRPAREIGGDFFDAYPILEGGDARRLGFVIADVSGKGISAALLMAFVRPLMRAALDRTARPADALERTNRILVDERRTGLFVTALCGVVDLATGIVLFANAGHELPILVPGDGSPIRSLPGSGPLLGAFGRLEVDDVRLELRPNDALILYTDGITDALNPAGERYGERRLLDTTRRARTGSAAEICRGIVGSVTRFQAGAPEADDLALLIVRRLGRD
jgi:phosphoserine phosphatase RsbU/P